MIQSVVRHALALAWLAAAAFRHARSSMPELLQALQAAPPSDRARRNVDGPAMGRALARWARRVPFRADCVVQALAAKMWMDRLGTPLLVRLAASRSDTIEAHVWMLTEEGEVVTGGRLDAPMTQFVASDGTA